MTYRSLSLYSPDFNPDDQPKIDPSAPPPIRFRHIAQLLLGSIVAGSFVGLLAGILAYVFTRSKFVTATVFGTSLYGSFIIGYHWLSQEQEWASLRTRFSPVGKKTLILSSLGAVALIVFILTVGWILDWAGFKLRDVPSPLKLDTWTQLPLAFLFIVVAVPIAEELLFRGMLLDWLRQKMNVWWAAVILSVIFALLHDNGFANGAVGWLAFTDRFLLGLAASALTIKYHSLRPSFAMHATLNGIACIASVLNHPA
jgi:membrane protease YdiL (CAAX protease family)